MRPAFPAETLGTPRLGRVNIKHARRVVGVQSIPPTTSLKHYFIYIQYMVRKSSRLSASQKKQVRQLINQSIETKHTLVASGAWDYVGDGLTTRTTLSELSALSQGVGDHTRVGDQVTVTKIYGKHLIRAYGTNAANNTTCRVMIVQSRGGALAAADMPDFYSNADLDKMVVLQDRLYSLSFGGTDYATGTGNNQWQSVHNFNIKAKRLLQRNLQYDDNNSSTPRNAPIYLYLVAEGVADVEYAGYANMYYKDA